MDCPSISKYDKRLYLFTVESPCSISAGTTPNHESEPNVGPVKLTNIDSFDLYLPFSNSIRISAVSSFSASSALGVNLSPTAVIVSIPTPTHLLAPKGRPPAEGGLVHPPS